MHTLRSATRRVAAVFLVAVTFPACLDMGAPTAPAPDAGLPACPAGSTGLCTRAGVCTVDGMQCQREGSGGFAHPDAGVTDAG